MDQLDCNLLAAWHEVREKLSNDRAALGRRYERGLRKALRRPPRAWCVALRASDTRIESSAFIEPHLVEERREHRLLMFGDLVRHLCRPVRIDWPGVTYDEAAVRLGIDPKTMYDWMRKGWVESRRERVPGRRGMPTRYVWTPGGGGLDVCVPQGRGAAWGTLWQSLWEKVPSDFEQVLRRVPRLRANRRHTFGQFVGWDWECPGRIAADGAELGCGRACKKLIAPLPVWTIDRALGTPAAARLVAESSPVRSRFACARCWNVQHPPTPGSYGAPGTPGSSGGSGGTDAAWNQLVSYLSGGLLYGREVARPPGICSRVESAGGGGRRSAIAR